MGFICLVLFLLLCCVIEGCLLLLGFVLLVYPFAKLGDLLFKFLGTKSDTTQNTFLLVSIAGWLGLWGFLYLATIGKWFTADQRNFAELLLALVTFSYPIPLVFLLALLKRNWYSILLAGLSLFFSSKPSSKN
jgi:hypothetical protein